MQCRARANPHSKPTCRQPWMKTSLLCQKEATQTMEITMRVTHPRLVTEMTMVTEAWALTASRMPQLAVFAIAKGTPSQIKSWVRNYRLLSQCELFVFWAKAHKVWSPCALRSHRMALRKTSTIGFTTKKCRQRSLGGRKAWMMSTNLSRLKNLRLESRNLTKLLSLKYSIMASCTKRKKWKFGRYEFRTSRTRIKWW